MQYGAHVGLYTYRIMVTPHTDDLTLWWVVCSLQLAGIPFLMHTNLTVIVILIRCTLSKWCYRLVVLMFVPRTVLFQRWTEHCLQRHDIVCMCTALLLCFHQSSEHWFHWRLPTSGRNYSLFIIIILINLLYRMQSVDEHRRKLARSSKINGRPGT